MPRKPYRGWRYYIYETNFYFVMCVVIVISLPFIIRWIVGYLEKYMELDLAPHVEISPIFSDIEMLIRLRQNLIRGR